MSAASPSLSGEPFEPTACFESRAHRKAMAYLGYGLALAEGFIVITGDAGAGKSTLLAHLVDPADGRLRKLILSCAQIEGGRLVPVVAQGVGLSTPCLDGDALLEALERRLESDLRAGKRTLLIVDDAHDLSPTALADLHLLSTYRVGGRALVQILLLGRTALRERLEASGLEMLRQRVIAHHHLEGLTLGEVEAYLHRRGEREELQLFASDVCELLHAQSGGLPGRIDALADRLTAGQGGDPADLADEARMLTLRSVRSGGAPDARQAPLAPALDPRLAAIEARVEAQEAVIRRILNLIADLAENQQSACQSSYRASRK